MKLATKPKDFTDVWFDFCKGIMVLVSLGLVLFTLHLIGTGALALYRRWGIWVALIPVSVIATWVIGHVANGYSEFGSCSTCEGCGIINNNMFSEYWHKRSCLPLLVHK